MLQGFKQFLMRGNVVDMAVGIVVGATFGTVITAFVDGLLNPLIAAIVGKPDLTQVGTFTHNNAQFSFGTFLTALLNFVLVAAAVYFFVVVPINKWSERRRKGEEEQPEEVDEDIALLREIRDLLAERRGGA